MTATPDYAWLSRRLGALVYRILLTGTADRLDAQTCFEAAEALRTLLDRNAALERERDEFEAKKISLQDDVIPGLIYRAEAAEAHVTDLEDLCNSLEAQAMGLDYDLKRTEDKLAEARKALVNLVQEIDDLVSESRGVVGLHLNGDVAEWGDLLPGGWYERLKSLDDARDVFKEVSDEG